MPRDTALSSNVLTSIYSNGGRGCTALPDREIKIILLTSVIIAPTERVGPGLLHNLTAFMLRMENSSDDA
jgi:hypothetical protein